MWVPRSQEVERWMYQYQEEIARSMETFQERHDAVFETSKHLAETTSAGPIQALDLCIQIESEFPGKLEEMVERAEGSKFGTLWGLIYMIEAHRLRG